MAHSRYAVKSATLTFGGSTYDMDISPVMKGEEKPAVEVTALTDNVKQFIPGALKEESPLTITLFQKGSGDITPDATPAALSIAVVLENGTTDVTATVSYNKAIVEKVAPPNIDASGDRKATYEVTFRPDGSVSGGNG